MYIIMDEGMTRCENGWHKKAITPVSGKHPDLHPAFSCGEHFGLYLLEEPSHARKFKSRCG